MVKSFFKLGLFHLNKLGIIFWLLGSQLLIDLPLPNLTGNKQLSSGKKKFGPILQWTDEYECAKRIKT